MPAFLAAAPSTDARIEELRTSFEDYLYRAPYKFGGKEVDRVTLLNVHCRLRIEERQNGGRLRLDVAGKRVVVPRPGHPVRHDSRGHEDAGREDRAHHARDSPSTRIRST